MTTTTFAITARNSDNQWNWDGSEFVKNGRGDSTTFPCNPEEWDAAKKVFADEFRPESKAGLHLVRSEFDEKTDELNDELVISIYANP